MVIYETGIASSAMDLMAKLDTFISAHGWSINACAVPTPGIGDMNPQLGAYVISSGESDGANAAVGVWADRWSTCGCFGYSGSDFFTAQPGSARYPVSPTTPLTHEMNMGAGPYTGYHFWIGDEGGAQHLYIALECQAGEFRHWSMAQVFDFGEVVGGWFLDSSYIYDQDFQRSVSENGNHRLMCDTVHDAFGPAGCGHGWVDYDSKTGVWQPVIGGDTVDEDGFTGSTRYRSLFAGQMKIGYQRYNLRTPQQPLIYFAGRPGGLRSPVGRLPNIRQVNVRNLFPGEIVAIGGNDWKTFPQIVKRIVDPSDIALKSSGLYGLAYLMP